MDATQISQQQQGFTLLEVVIALLIFSVALVGLAGLHATAHRSNQFALEYTIATQQAYNLMERIQANAIGRQQGEYNAIDPAANLTPIACSSSCSPAEIAQNDIAQWQAAIKNNPSLVNAVGGSSQVDGNRLLIQVQWDSRARGGSSCISQPPLDCVEIEMEL